MRKAVLVTVAAGMMLGGTGMAMAAETGTDPSAGDAGCVTSAAPRMLTAAQAADVALRSAGGRVAGVQLTESGGRALYSVRLVRGERVRTATVDAFTGEVTSVVNGGRADSGTDTGTGVSTDDDGGDDDDDGADDDDEGPVRQGAEANK